MPDLIAVVFGFCVSNTTKSKLRVSKKCILVNTEYFVSGFKKEKEGRPTCSFKERRMKLVIGRTLLSSPLVDVVVVMRDDVATETILSYLLALRELVLYDHASLLPQRV